MVVAITGGIATGKSSVTGRLAEGLGAPSCSCDAIVHQLYDTEEVVSPVARRFPGLVGEGGRLDRRRLGQEVFSRPEDRRWIEALLHPLVLERVDAWLRENEDSPHCLVEVPLLYEVDFPLKRDVDVVVACSERKQLERLQQRDQLHPKQNHERISAQLPLSEKIVRGDIIIWNEGSYMVLNRLVRLAALRIQNHTP